MPPEIERLLQYRLQLGRQPRRLIRRAKVPHQEGELIAAPAGQHARCGRDRPLEAAAGLHHQLIPGSMAERLVDQLEAVDGDQEDAQSPVASGAQNAIELLHEVVAIRQAGEGIVEPRAVDALLQAFALFDLPYEFLLSGMQLPACRRK